MASCCARIRDDLSAYADDTLAPKRWEQVSYHLAGCAACRADLAAITSVCSELSRCRETSTAPDALAARLESIAGESAGMPLYMASGRGELPSARRTRTRRVAQGGVALLAVVMSAVVLAVLIAPDPARLTDPVKTAREQFSMSTSAVSVNEAVGAVLLASERGADFGQSVSYQQRGTDGRLARISADRASRLLRGATESDASLTGTQKVWVSDGKGLYRTADVRTTKVAGEGAQLEVLDARGDRFMSSFLPAFGARPVEAPEEWTFSESVLPEQVGDRSAVRLLATVDGAPAAAWWLDTQTGVLLWTERYNGAGDVQLAMGYKDLHYGDATLSDDITQHISLEPASASQTEGWCVGLPECPQEVAGLPLVAYSSSDRQGHRSMMLVYSDGFESAVVGWTEGVLEEGSGELVDQRAGAPTVALWQADEAVVWVTSNGSEQMIREIGEQLPQHAEHHASLLDRVRAGLGRLVPVG